MGQEYPLVKVIWLDPHSDDDWADVEDVCVKQQLVETKGTLVKETKDAIIVTLNFLKQEEGVDVSCTMIIPKIVIQSIKRLSYKESPFRYNVK
jgi:hypothetical protein